MYNSETIMKFKILDITSHVSKNDMIHRSDSDTYQYLDDLLDKTFVTDYFLDRSVSTDDESSPHKINNP